MSFRLRNIPVLSWVGADRADDLRTDVDAAVAGWSEAVLLRVDNRNQVLPGRRRPGARPGHQLRRHPTG